MSEKITKVELSQWYNGDKNPLIVENELTGSTIHPLCGSKMSDHGWCPTSSDRLIICPGDFILKINDKIFIYGPEALLKLDRQLKDSPNETTDILRSTLRTVCNSLVRQISSGR